VACPAPHRSPGQPATPQFVTAADIVWPPGVVICRNGEVIITSRNASMMACSISSAKPRRITAP